MTNGGVDIVAARESGLDPEQLDAMAAYLDGHVGPGRFAHAALLISRDGRPVMSTRSGAAREDGTLLAENALFRIASMTKPVTALAWTMLMEQGLTDLDQRVDAVLPELADVGVYVSGGDGDPFATRPVDTPMRMVDLLCHTSGFTYGFQNRTPVDAAYRDLDLDDFHQARDPDGYIAALAQLPLEFAPGSAWNYSVSNDVLGVVVERLSGMSLDAFFSTRIFAPLGMDDTFFRVPPDRLDRMTDAWMMDGARGPVLYDRGAQTRWRMPRRFHGGGGGLVSGMADYHRFCRMLLQRGELDGVRLVREETVAMMTRNHLPGGGDLSTLSRSMFSESDYAGIGYGLGFGVTVDPAQAGEFHWGGLFSTFFSIDPVEGTIMILMTQLMPSSAVPVRRTLKSMLASALRETRR